MNKTFFLLLFFVLFSCKKNNIELYYSGEEGEQDIVTDATGVQYPTLDPPSYQYCGPGWGRKMCRFLLKYDNTTWTETESYNSEFSDIRFSRFNGDPYFISFFKFDSITSFCKGWKLGETIYDGKKWHIKIKKDEVDVLTFEYNYYGTNEEIEFTKSYKFEVIDGLLHFTNKEGQTIIFKPSQKTYSEDSLNTNEIIKLDGCMF